MINHLPVWYCVGKWKARARLPFLCTLSRAAAAASRELLLYRERVLRRVLSAFVWASMRRDALRVSPPVEWTRFNTLPSLELYSSELRILSSTEPILNRTFVLRIKLKSCGSGRAPVVSIQVFCLVVNHLSVLLGAIYPFTLQKCVKLKGPLFAPIQSSASTLVSTIDIRSIWWVSILVVFIVSRSTNLTNLPVASTTASSAIDAVLSSCRQTGSTFASIHSANRSQVTLYNKAASLMEPLPFSQINQTGHPEPMIATEWYSWLVTHLVDSNLPPVTTFGYLNLCLLAVSFLLNLYLSLVIHGKRSNQSRTHSLMKNIFVTNVLTAGISLPLLVHTHLPVNWPITPLLSSIVCKVVPSLHILSQ